MNESNRARWSLTPSDSEPAAALVNNLCDQGWTSFTGVPCSFLKGIFEIVERFPVTGNGPCYIPAVREDSAVALAAGLYLAGRLPVVLMQNSGLGSSLGTLLSLHHVYSLPLFLVVSWRGHSNDAVEHEVMAKAMVPILDASDVPHYTLIREDVAGAVERVSAAALNGLRPAALLITEAV